MLLVLLLLIYGHVATVKWKEKAVVGTIMATKMAGQECLPKLITHSQLGVQATAVAPSSNSWRKTSSMTPPSVCVHTRRGSTRTLGSADVCALVCDICVFSTILFTTLFIYYNILFIFISLYYIFYIIYIYILILYNLYYLS